MGTSSFGSPQSLRETRASRTGTAIVWTTRMICRSCSRVIMATDTEQNVGEGNGGRRRTTSRELDPPRRACGAISDVRQTVRRLATCAKRLPRPRVISPARGEQPTPSPRPYCLLLWLASAASLLTADLLHKLSILLGDAFKVPQCLLVSVPKRSNGPAPQRWCRREGLSPFRYVIFLQITTCA